MVKVRKNGGEVEIKDFLTKLYLRQGWELVPVEEPETPMVVDQPKEVKQPKKTRSKAKK